jgi:hypothetical protein
MDTSEFLFHPWLNKIYKNPNKRAQQLSNSAMEQKKWRIFKDLNRSYLCSDSWYLTWITNYPYSSLSFINAQSAISEEKISILAKLQYTVYRGHRVVGHSECLFQNRWYNILCSGFWPYFLCKFMQISCDGGSGILLNSLCVI